MTHTALLQRITGTERIKIRRAGKSWVDERGIRYNTETGRRHMDSGNGIKPFTGKDESTGSSGGGFKLAMPKLPSLGELRTRSVTLGY